MKIPNQIKRLIVPFAILGIVLLVARHFLVPASFGKYGHYRANAVDEIAAGQIQYAGHEACAECHNDKVEQKEKGYHKDLNCEVCHLAAQSHVENPLEVKPAAPRERGYCPLCHGYLPSRPTGFPQIIAETHNPVEPCITCHEPHDPKPPHTPEQCSACHAGIARTKAISHHANLPCTKCHETSEKHKAEPRLYPPKKPVNREFCGECHAENAQSAKHIPRVDMNGHYREHLCWQCHYPHMPEAF